MIGTLTFHWPSNYGAVLQAYALQKFLKKNGYDTEIINYLPKRIPLIQFIMLLEKLEFYQLLKMRKFQQFRKQELILSDKVYRDNAALKKCSDAYQTIICGSDQIWNESFTNRAEGKPTLSYFLNFCDENKKISYAVSFGTDCLSEQTKNLIFPEIRKFQFLSVREESGKKILDDLGFESQIVLDPTLLLEEADYEQLLKRKIKCNKEKCFSYILHQDQKQAISISNYMKQQYGEKTKKNYFSPNIGIHEWLYKIKNAEFVVTNSFHGMVFSLIFQKKFIVVPVEKSKMNDRIYTLLKKLDLEDRIIAEYEETRIENLIKQEINWGKIKDSLDLLKKGSKEFLLDAIESNNNN